MYLVPAPPATASLVRRAQQGDPAAFQALVRQYLRAAYSIALSVVGRTADAEDVAQEALLLAFERLETCREPERFAGWLLQIVRNQARNWLDKRRLRDVPAGESAVETADDDPGPDGRADRAPLLRALAALPAIQREVVLLHDLEGWTHIEIGTALGLSEVGCRQQLFLARRSLRATLGDRERSTGSTP